MLKQGTCTQCEKHVEFQQIHTGQAIAYKCSNCWAILSAGDMTRIDKLTAQLAELDQARAELIRGV
jgi:DNA-directed RNA polymerase subunit RPC12/RpoP